MLAERFIKSKTEMGQYPMDTIILICVISENSWEISISFLLISRAQKVQDSEFLGERIQIPL